MSDTPENPPAFPQDSVIHPNGEVEYGSSGMSLRDYFAGQALPMLIDQVTSTSAVSSRQHAELIASKSYQMADAMMSRREKA